MQNLKIIKLIKNKIEYIKDKLTKNGWTEIIAILFLIIFISKQNLNDIKERFSKK
tara:strand:- start:3 stop:167 length:165 start_codon:yes stop_codon:yes gene_type:complete